MNQNAAIQGIKKNALPVSRVKSKLLNATGHVRSQRNHSQLEQRTSESEKKKSEGAAIPQIGAAKR